MVSNIFIAKVRTCVHQVCCEGHIDDCVLTADRSIYAEHASLLHSGNHANNYVTAGQRYDATPGHHNDVMRSFPESPRSKYNDLHALMAHAFLSLSVLKGRFLLGLCDKAMFYLCTSKHRDFGFISTSVLAASQCMLMFAGSDDEESRGADFQSMPSSKPASRASQAVSLCSEVSDVITAASLPRAPRRPSRSAQR